MTDQEENALIARLAQGDKSAFQALYDRYKKKLATNLFHLLKSWDLVEEVLQELFIRVWENRSKIDVERSFRSYLYRIASNLVYDYYRSASRDRVLAARFWEHIELHQYPQRIQEQILRDKELMRTIDMLPPQRKLVFRLCKFEGFSYEEVAKRLHISKAAVNDHISKANRFIIENYSKDSVLFIVLLSSALLKGV